VEWAVPLGPQGFTGENQPDRFSDADGLEEHWDVHSRPRHVFASDDDAVTDPGSPSVAQMLQRGRWAEVPAEAAVEPSDEVTADWGLTVTESTATVDMAPEPHPDLFTLLAWLDLTNRDHVLSPTNANQADVHGIPNDLMSDRAAEPR
jgi:hypothetical protein